MFKDNAKENLALTPQISMTGLSPKTCLKVDNPP